MRNGAGRPTLLVIDDDPAWRSLYRLEFEAHFEIVEAGDGHDGLAKIEQSLPDLVILDLSMPRMDGARFLSCLRDRGLSTPVIVCSAHEAEAGRIARLDVRVVAKSPNLAELTRAVLALAPASR